VERHEVQPVADDSHLAAEVERLEAALREARTAAEADLNRYTQALEDRDRALADAEQRWIGELALASQRDAETIERLHEELRRLREGLQGSDSGSNVEAELVYAYEQRCTRLGEEVEYL
jgi:Tfp pilus assembly protein FimT